VAAPAQGAPLFESRDDRAAQSDLQRLSEAEHRYWAANGRYTVSFAELSTPPFDATPAVYLQVETANQHHFRAIAMPRLSTTARVFALEASDGASLVSEMTDEEVSTYVLGALRPIRHDQLVKRSLTTLFTVSVFGLAVYGFLLHRRGGPGHWKVSLPYFLGLSTIYATLILSTYIDDHTYIGPLVLAMAGIGAASGTLGIAAGTVALWQTVVEEHTFHLRRMALVGVLLALLGLISPFYTFYHYLPWIGDLTERSTGHRLLPP